MAKKATATQTEPTKTPAPPAICECVLSVLPHRHVGDDIVALTASELEDVRRGYPLTPGAGL